MPDMIEDDDHIEFIKNDFLLNPYCGKLSELKKLDSSRDDDFFIHLFNLDKIIEINKSLLSNDISVSKKLMKFISSSFPEKSAVYYSKASKKAVDIFMKKKINIFNTNEFAGNNNFVQSIINYIKHKQLLLERPARSFVRVGFFPQRLNKCEIVVLNSKNQKALNSYIKDLSLNGISLILFDKDDFVKFKPNDIVQITLFLPTDVIKISEARIVRTNEKDLLLGINFDINDRKMIKKKHSDHLVMLIYHDIKQSLSLFNKK